MRDRYYQVVSSADVPGKSALVHIWHHDGEALARLDDDEERVEAAPDLILFRAALARARHHVAAIFILLEDASLWRDEWGDLVDYRVTSRNGKPALRITQAPASR